MNGEATEAAVERVYCHLAATNSLTWKDSFFPLQKYSWTLLRSFFHACMEYVGFAHMLYKMKCFFLVVSKAEDGGWWKNRSVTLILLSFIIC